MEGAREEMGVNETDRDSWFIISYGTVTASTARHLSVFREFNMSAAFSKQQ